MQRVSQVFPTKKTSYLQRGINKENFHPRWKDRKRVEEFFGIPPDRFLVLYAGRISPEKGVTILARAARILLDQSQPVQVMIAGVGNQTGTIRELLGPAVTFPGAVPHSTLAWLYASADLFVLPSEVEVFPNAVIEAKASGLPVLVSAQGGAAQCVKEPGVDGLVVGESDPALWAQAIRSLQQDSSRRSQIGEAARKQIEAEWPTWQQVVASDLIPVWQAVA